jgi:tetratricopeptide (TPR) repeat protein
MMIERHYDDESLIALIESDRLASDVHLPSCPNCSEKVESFRMIADALRDEDTWSTLSHFNEPAQSTIATLRAFADRMTDEDTRAEAWLHDLLAGPRETWRSKLAQHPEYRTAGMVRKLIASSDRAIDTMPPDAVAMTALAADIADHLDPSDHPADTVTRLRGAAWREKAFALFYTGQYADAEKSVQIADAMFSLCSVDEYDRARTGIVASTVHKNMDRNDAALMAARNVVDIFAAYGDGSRYVSARSSEAGALAQAGRYSEALQIWTELELRFKRDDFSDAHARALGNVAFALRHLGRARESIQSYQQAAEMFETAGTKSEAARVRWNVAAILFESGRWDDAAERLAAVRMELRHLGMFGPAAVASLDLAEVRLLQQRQSDVPDLCSEAIDFFNSAGVGYSARALRAVAFMREAAIGGRATPELARTVRDYVRKLPSQPSLLFLPPPTTLQ